MLGLVTAWVVLTAGCGRRAAFTEVWSHIYGPRNVYAVASVDLNGDGFADLLVGAPGGVEAYFGSLHGLPAKADWTWQPPARDGGNVGYCVGYAGHMDGDPYPEIYVSSLAARDRGMIYLFKTGPHGPQSEPWKALVGPTRGGGFGERVARVGNLYGDGYDALAVADYSYGRQRGMVYVYRGGPQGPGAKPDWQAEGEHPGDWFGYSLCGPGDLDGDGLDDLVVGSKNCNGSCLTWMAGNPDLARQQATLHSAAWAQAALLPMAGRLSVFYGSRRGPAAKPGLVMEGEANHELYAYSLAAAGHPADGGHAGLLVGSLGWKGRRGRVELLTGGARGKPLRRIWQSEGDYADEAFGFALSMLPDLAGKGEPGLLVGGLAPDDARVYWPMLRPFQSMRQANVLSGEPLHKRISEVLGSAGDIYGDGHSEVFMLIPGKLGTLKVLKFNYK